jgi:hypothetical protein
MSRSDTKSKRGPDENGRKGKPISFYPMSTREALKKAMNTDPKKIPKASGK